MKVNGEKVDEEIKSNGFVVVAEFDCFKTGKTFTSIAKPYYDGRRYYDLRSEQCPYCDRMKHWKTVEL